MSFLVGQTQLVTSDNSFFFWEKSKNKGKWSIMKKNSFILYGNPMYSNFDFMINDNNSLYFSSSTSSTRLDAQSAPPECEWIFDRLCDEYIEWVVRADKQLPLKWNMLDLVRTVIGDEVIHMPSFLTYSCYDVMLHPK